MLGEKFVEHQRLKDVSSGVLEVVLGVTHPTISDLKNKGVIAPIAATLAKPYTCSLAKRDMCPVPVLENSECNFSRDRRSSDNSSRPSRGKLYVSME